MVLTEGSKVFLGILTSYVGLNYYFRHRRTCLEKQQQEEKYLYHLRQPEKEDTLPMYHPQEPIAKDIQTNIPNEKNKPKEINIFSSLSSSSSSNSNNIDQIYLSYLMKQYPIQRNTNNDMMESSLHMIEQEGLHQIDEENPISNHKNPTDEDILSLTQTLHDRVRSRVKLIRDKYNTTNNNS